MLLCTSMTCWGASSDDEDDLQALYSNYGNGSMFIIILGMKWLISFNKTLEFDKFLNDDT